jgi:hypothetical protein
MVDSWFFTLYWKHVPYNSCTTFIWALYFISMFLDWHLGFEPTLQHNFGWNSGALQNETHMRASILNIAYNMALVTKFSNVGRFHDPRICQLYYVGPLKQSKNSCLVFILSYWHLEFWVELYSWHYSQESLFIPELFIEYTIQSINIVENNDIPYWHYSYFIPVSISSHFLSFFPWR